MNVTSLTQDEANILLNLEKYYIGDNSYKYPVVGGALHISIHSKDKKEEFSLDIRRSSIEFSKNTFQNRAKKAIVLLRLDMGGSPHRNPDDREIMSPHLHIFREGFHDKWAYPLPDNIFTDLNNIATVLDEFMNFCKIIKKPIIEEELFI